MNSRIREQIEAALAGHKDLEVVDIRFGSSGGKRLIQVLLDKEGGIGLDDLTEVNRYLGKAMDAWDVGPESYMLEVSSAGLERPLVKIEHFSRFTGRKAKILLHEPLQENRKKFTGTILAVQGDTVVLETDTGQVDLPFTNIKKANLVFEM